MNTLRIIRKEFVRQIRDWRSNTLMILFPIILIAILGVALSGQFTQASSLPEIKADFTIEGSGPMVAAFRSLVEGATPTGVQFAAAQSKTEGIRSLENADTSAYLVVGSDRIELYRNARRPTESGIVKSVVTAFLLRYNAAAAAAGGAADGRASAAGAARTSSAVGAYTENRSLSGKRSPTATGFYSVAMLTMILLYASLFGASRARVERRLGTANRILAAPVGRPQFLTGQSIGGLSTLLVQAAVLITFTHFILGADWGTHLLTVGAVVLAESVMVVSMGVAVGYLLPNEAAAAAVLNTLIPVLAFFSGAYVPLSMMGPAVARIGDYSPLKWVNQALLGVIYGNDFSAVGPAIAINLAVAVIFVATSAIFARREAIR